MKKVLALLLGLSMMLGIAACAKKVEVPSKRDVKKAAAEKYDMEFKVDSEDVSKDEKEAEWVLISDDGSLEVTVAWNAKNPEDFDFDAEEHPEATETEPVIETVTEPVETETETEATTAATTRGASVINGTIVNFDEMNFYVNGKKFTLGQSTLQDMIDAGVPFDESDLQNAGNNVKSNSGSDVFKIVLGDYYYARVYFMNDTEDGKAAKDCFAHEITISIDNDKAQDILTFDFPFTFSMEELIANSGDPNEDIFHYESDDGSYISDTVKYSKESEKYYNKNYYEFDFVNGELDSIRMTYIP
ncbi:MAG: hypothetical protein IKD91_06150 [Clostridiales bacterium]|nr:hypothetical protein [Clostridiales bacterium]